MDRFVNDKYLKVIDKKLSIFCLPRRLYYYVPNMLLRPIGRLFAKIENVLNSASLTAPLMFVYYALGKDGVHIRSTKYHHNLRDRFGAFRHLIWVLPIVTIFLLISNALMGWEVLRGRKDMFEQH